MADYRSPGQNDSLAWATRFKSIPYRIYGMQMGTGARLWLVYTESGAVVQAERALNWQLIVTIKCWEKYPCSGRRGHTIPPPEPAYVFAQACISLLFVPVSSVRRHWVGTCGGSTHAEVTPVLGCLRHLSRAHLRSTKPARLRHIETYDFLFWNVGYSATNRCLPRGVLRGVRSQAGAADRTRGGPRTSLARGPSVAGQA